MRRPLALLTPLLVVALAGCPKDGGAEGVSTPPMLVPSPVPLFGGRSGGLRERVARTASAAEPLRVASTAREGRLCTLTDLRIACLDLPGVRVGQPRDLVAPVTLLDAVDGAVPHVSVLGTLTGQPEHVVYAVGTRAGSPLETVPLPGSYKLRTMTAAFSGEDWVQLAQEIGVEKDTFTVSRRSQAKGAEPESTRIDLAFGQEAEAALPWIFAIAHDPHVDAPSALLAFRVLPFTEPVGKPVVLFETKRVPTIQAICRSPSGLALAVREVDAKTETNRFVFERGGKFTEVLAEGGPREKWEGRVDCFDDAGDTKDQIVLSVARDVVKTGEPRSWALEQQACSPRGCKAWRETFSAPDVTPFESATDGGAYRDPRVSLARVGDRRLVTWEAADGIRLLVGEIGQRRGVPLFPSRVTSPVVFGVGAGANAVVFAQDGDAVVGARVDETGKVTPLAPAEPR